MEEETIIRWFGEADTIADILRRLRQLQELKLQEVADHAGLSKSYVSMLDRGKDSLTRILSWRLLLSAYSYPVPMFTRDHVSYFSHSTPMHHHSSARQCA